MSDAARYTDNRFFTDRDGAIALRMRPGELSDFSRDWTHHLAPGEAIVTSEWVSAAAGVQSSGDNGRIATVWLSESGMDFAGAPFAELVNTIETIDGRQDSWTVRLYPPEG